MVQRGNVIIVTTKAKLNEEIQSEYKFKKNLEDDEPLVTRQVNVIYRQNPAPTTRYDNNNDHHRPARPLISFLRSLMQRCSARADRSPGRLQGT